MRPGARLPAMDLIRPDTETPRRLAVAAIVLAFCGYSVGTGEQAGDPLPFPVLGMFVGIYGMVAAIAPPVRSRLDPDWLLTFVALGVIFMLVIATVAKVVLPN